MKSGFGPEQLLDCYRRGVFPMASASDDPRVFLVEPHCRGVLPLDRFRIPRKLRQLVRRETFEIRFDTAFRDVVEACSAPARGRERSWINRPIVELYTALHRMGRAHSVECWRDGLLAGGLYGVVLGAAFFGESMFTRARDASKVALVHLVARLIAGGFRLLDTQFVTPHLRAFGAVEIDRAEFHLRLADALDYSATFSSQSPSQPSGARAVQLITQTS